MLCNKLALLFSILLLYKAYHYMIV